MENADLIIKDMADARDVLDLGSQISLLSFRTDCVGFVVCGHAITGLEDGSLRDQLLDDLNAAIQPVKEKYLKMIYGVVGEFINQNRTPPAEQ